MELAKCKKPNCSPIFGQDFLHESWSVSCPKCNHHTIEHETRNAAITDWNQKMATSSDGFKAVDLGEEKVEMISVVFSFSSGGPHGKKQETVEFDKDTPEEEIEKAFNSWLYENSDACWWYEDGRERKL